MCVPLVILDSSLPRLKYFPHLDNDWMLPKVDGLLWKSLKLQPILKRALSRVVKHLVEVLLELRILELVKDASDLLVDGIFHYIDSCGNLL